MEYIGYIKLTLLGLVPVAASVLLNVLFKSEAGQKINYWTRQVIIGIIFGGIAVLGTELGVPIDGATMNVRDAAPVCAGLIFGAPAGIIAGIIGGVERWIAVAWGVGSFTRVACSVSTVIAGIYAAALRKYMFDDKRPGWLLAFAIGIVMETFHLTMVFVTNMSEAARAATVVKTCSGPMILGNGVSVMLAVFFVSLMDRGKRVLHRRDTLRISQTIQRRLLLCICVVFLITTGFTGLLQVKIGDGQTENILRLNVEDVASDINRASGDHLLLLCREIRDEILESPAVLPSDLKEKASRFGVSEINYVDENGIIRASTNSDFIGFDMASGEQSASFLSLLGGYSDKEMVQPYGPIAADSTIMRKYAAVSCKGGLVQVGYDAARFQKDISEQVKDITQNRHVGEEGYVLVFSNSLDLVSAPSRFPMGIGSTLSLLRSISGSEELTVFEADVHEEPCFCMTKKSEGYYIVSVYPESEALLAREVSIYVTIFMEVLVFAAMFAVIYFLIKRVVVNKIVSINGSLARITAGNLNEKVNVRSNEEFASLSDDINTTVDSLKNYIDEAEARMEKELEFARGIQHSALPSIFPAFPGRKDFDIYACMFAAKTVGGDFYDFYMTGKDTINCMISDVSGKGIPAALFMMRAKTQLKNLTEQGCSVDKVYTLGNERLCEGNSAMMFVTSWQAEINLKTGIVSYANAGHNPPLIKRANGGFEYLKSKACCVLGVMEGMKYNANSLQLYPGDTLILYTDGVTEATDANEQLYGEDRLQNFLNSHEFADMKNLCEELKKDIDAFVGEADQFDDITMVAFQYKGQGEVMDKKFENAKIDDVTELTDCLDEALDGLGCPLPVRMKFDIALDEIYSNIVKFAYGGESGPARVIVRPTQDNEGAELIFVDKGVSYNPLEKDDPDVTLTAEMREVGGLGIFMVRKIMDGIDYERIGEHNVLTLRKYFK